MKKIICFVFAIAMVMTLAVSAFAADADTTANAQEIKTFLAGLTTKFPGLGFKAEDLNAANNYIDSYINTNTITAAQVTAIKTALNEGVAIYNANNKEETNLSNLPANVKTDILAKANEAVSVLGLSVSTKNGTVKFVRVSDGVEVYTTSATIVKSTGAESGVLPMVITCSAAAVLLVGAYLITRKLGAKA
ncbi:MAG: hypothetical protein IJR89_04370 [Clostridia bacterium]|nr:hypothetical protein [Clostridia bacterium]